MGKYTIAIDAAACKGCGYCKLSCAQGVFEKGMEFNAKGYQPYVPVRAGNCVVCLACFYACPDFALSIASAGGRDETSF